ncbi:hypothetical protein BpHYR1_002196 [Brachionus plicatilis]|uniref:Transmembrane protein n=1 Tax=Brachionus plicatilis TaxID=10195 RepID=A0A3M7R2B7_BRAPC|nr:hypothetical protein BpHYR1_002196 [Brachionus plicatilis]
MIRCTNARLLNECCFIAFRRRYRASLSWSRFVCIFTARFGVLRTITIQLYLLIILSSTFNSFYLSLRNTMQIPFFAFSFLGFSGELHKITYELEMYKNNLYPIYKYSCVLFIQIKSYNESSSVNEWSKDNPVQLKKTLNRQGEILKFFNKKLFKYLNNKLIKKDIYFKSSNIFTQKKFMEESTKQDMSKLELKSDYMFKEYVKNGRIYDNINQMRNLYNNEEFYYDYGEYYYDQNQYENDYIDIGDDFSEINNQNSIKQQLSKQKNYMFMYNALILGSFSSIKIFFEKNYNSLLTTISAFMKFV